MRKTKYFILLFLFIFSLIFLFIIYSENNNKLKIIFLDVGQGDSILITDGPNQVLIDGGPDGKKLLEKLGKFIPFWDRNIEVISPSHPDSDHITGLVSALRTYRVQNILETNSQSDSNVYKQLEQEIKNNKIQKINAVKNTRIIFPDGAIAEVLYPFESLPNQIDQDTNSHSIVLRLTYGQNNFLFTGDLPTTSEQELLSNNINLKSDILKVGHHGSKYSTGNDFLDIVKPQDAIISVGKNNTYGHPNREVLQRLTKHKINIFRTDEVGDVEYVCEGIDKKCFRK